MALILFRTDLYAGDPHWTIAVMERHRATNHSTRRGLFQPRRVRPDGVRASIYS